MPVRFCSSLWGRSAPPNCADMQWRWMAYLTAVVGSVVFYVFYQEWFSWFLLVILLILPWFSLILSLPAMLAVKADLRCPPKCRQDMPVRTQLRTECFFPVPPIRCNIRLINRLNSHSYLGKPGELIPTAHCGLLEISYPKIYVYDYLGLFRRALRMSGEQKIYITPKPVASSQQRKPEGAVAATLLRPKPGGGYSEIHDLRLYRPGDDLRHIHWKMSAKTGKIIYRGAKRLCGNPDTKRRCRCVRPEIGTACVEQSGANSQGHGTRSALHHR